MINAGYVIKYDPEAVVYHHRRSDLWKHFRQIGNYALHRGFFAKKYPKTSLKIGYFAPTLFVLYLIFWTLILFRISDLELRILVSLPTIIYCFGLLLDFLVISIRYRNPLVGLITIPMILFTHIWYGIRFVWGLMKLKLDQ